MLFDAPHLSFHAPSLFRASASFHTPWFERRGLDRPVTFQKKSGRWILELTKDPFRETVQCRLHTQGVTVEHAAVVLHAPAGANTFDAYYRLDGGPAVSWRVNAMELVSHGATIDQESLRNPSGGRVAIPLRLAAAARSITIRPSDRSRSYAFSLRQLDIALSQAKALGCGPDFIPGDAS